MRLLKTANIKKFAVWGIALAFVYAAITRFTDFFMVPRNEKFVYIVFALISSSFFPFLIFNQPGHTMVQRSGKKHILYIILAGIFVSVIINYFLPPLFFPEIHRLQINPLSGAVPQTLTILQIDRIEQPGGNHFLVPNEHLELQGDWDFDEVLDEITWRGGDEAYLSYSRFMQAGMAVTFKTHPNSAPVKITWDGSGQILDLGSEEEGVYALELAPGLNWRNADFTRKLLVGSAYIAHGVSAAGITLLIIYVFLTISKEQARVLAFSTIILFFLFGIVSLADPIIDFPDPFLETAVRNAAGISEGSIREHRLLTLARLDLSDQNISNLEGIQYLTNLVELNLRGNKINDISPLKQLTLLQELNLRGNQISDIAPLSSLSQLERLNLRGNPIIDITPIHKLSQINDLNLHGIQLGDDLEFLRGYQNLSKLNIRNCGISDVGVIAELMAKGVLQDDAFMLVKAEFDLRDNPIPRVSRDGYAALRPYWNNIYDRAPFTLPALKEVAAPIISHSAGFYTQGFSLEISVEHPDLKIFYTLDGSQPTTASPIYAGPLYIKKPEEKSSGVILRAKAFSAEGKQSETTTRTFIFIPEDKEQFSLPLVSIVTDPANLFDEDQGIYVAGRMFADYGGAFARDQANFNQRGGQWERPIYFEYFDSAGDLQLASAAGMRIQGASTRSYPQKSLRIIADDWYGDLDHFENRIFTDMTDAVSGDKIENLKSFILRNSGNNANYPLFRSTVIQEIFSETSLDTFNYQMVVVFLNGEYWGIYNLRETMDEDFLAAHYQQDEVQFTILERNAQLNYGSVDGQSDYLAMLEYIAEHDISDTIHYEYIKTRMDIDNYIDYQIAEIYSANYNWPHDNIKYWRFRVDGYGPQAPAGLDGRWRWLLFDLDTGYGYSDDAGFDDTTLERAVGEFLFRSLLDNAEFRTEFINRFAVYLNTILLPENVAEIVDQSEAVLLPEISEHIARWGIAENSRIVWQENVNIIRDFAHRRPSFLFQHIADFFNLTGDAEVTIYYDPAGGAVRVNSFEITPDGIEDGDELYWSGRFFKDIPIYLTAEPNPGYQFKGWIDANLADPQIELILTEDISITAVFEKTE